MKTNSKIIGSSFERKICKLLSLAISNGTRTDLFWRTPSSGAIGSQSNKYEGDIMPIESINGWNYIIECKTTKRGSIIPLRSSVKHYIISCEKRYKNKQWLLIIGIRGNGDIFLLTKTKFSDDYIARIEHGDTQYFVYDFYTFAFDKLTGSCYNQNKTEARS